MLHGVILTDFNSLGDGRQCGSYLMSTPRNKHAFVVRDVAMNAYDVMLTREESVNLRMFTLVDQISEIRSKGTFAPEYHAFCYTSS